MLASTKTGAVVQADVVFLRDLAERDYETIYDFKATPERILKLACFMEILGLPDCAAELIVKRADMLPFDRDELLDRLVPNFLGYGLSYHEYIRRFEADPKALFPSRQMGQETELEAELLAPDLRREPVALDGFGEVTPGALSTEGEEGSRRDPESVPVRTPAVRWGYAAVLPLPTLPGRLIVVAVDLEVVSGQVYLALADPELQYFSEHRGLDLGERPTLIVRHHAFNRLLVRNGDVDTSSTCWIHQVAMLISPG
jgi:hypothetical protein